MKFNFEDLVVYQKSLDFINFVYSTTNEFPKEELYGLTSQFRRASVSIALNISEGSGGSDKEFSRFLRISSNSLKECVVCTTVATRQKYISEEINQKCRRDLIEISKMISGLHRYLRNKK